MAMAMARVCVSPAPRSKVRCGVVNGEKSTKNNANELRNDVLYATDEFLDSTTTNLPAGLATFVQLVAAQSE